MPLDFPDLNSLLWAAKRHSFRAKDAAESDARYRDALARHVSQIDPVEAMEIRSGRGWDKWDSGDRACFILERTAKAANSPPAEAGGRQDK